MPCVSYWKTKESVAAKVTYDADGALVMKMEGEKYPLNGFPRGYLLFGKLSKLKHEIKNQIFNDSWWALEAGKNDEEIVKRIKGEVFDRIFALAEDTKYDRVPPERMMKPVREIYRAWSAVTNNERALALRDILCLILMEDDSYRMRVQWLVKYFNPNSLLMRVLGKDTVTQFEKALVMLEHAEVLGDMKERIRLLRRILLVCLRNKTIGDLFRKFCREVDWNKVALSEGDKFHFRGKYFKVDMDIIEY